MAQIQISLDSACESQTLPATCCYCSSSNIHPWGRHQKNIQDTLPLDVAIRRWHCKDCGRTFRSYPPGMDRGHLSRRLRRLAALVWVLGLSLRHVTEAFAAQGVPINRMTVWRESQKLVEEFNRLENSPAAAGRFWIDPVCAPANRGQPDERVELALQLSPGPPTRLGCLNTQDAAAALAWFEHILLCLDLPALVSQGFQPIL